ncbi:MAG: glycoside hydrolase family 25 [Pseudobutyrivibrio sp.]|nr:glycoside hydrolase family 25 [Pseudobutyrivibrio sp.]
MNNEYDEIRRKRASSRARRRRRMIIKRRIILASSALCLVLIITGAVLIVKHFTKDDDGAVASEVEVSEEVGANLEDTTANDNPEANIDVESEDGESSSTDPQATVTVESGAAIDVADLVSASNVGENSSITYGIDVSKFQGTIDWSQVANAGINFVMVRVGYRDSTTGEIKADTNAKFNMQEAEKYGIKIGAYFFSTAVTNEEAVEEANWVTNYIAKYPITYPVGYNCEGFENNTSRQFGLSKDDRSNIAMAFLNQIYNSGYTPIFYASRNELVSDTKWNTSSIEKKYKIWMAWYNQDTSNIANGPAYDGQCAMWQYTNQGTVAGISKKVDVDVAYFGYNGTESAKDTSARETASADVEALMKFTDTNETVTAKSKTNLRDKPSQGADSTVKATLENGQTATRTGTSSSGWSRVSYNGATYYAVSSYLTTDLSAPAQTQAQAPVAEEPHQPEVPAGFKTKFIDVNETVTAKELVNLRSKPSVTDADSTVVATLSAGQNAIRTGVNNEYGWSRVEYNGQILYCVSSYIKVVE